MPGVVATSAWQLPPPAPVRFPGAWPVLGHAPALLRDPLGFLSAAYRAGEVVSIRLGRKSAFLVNGSDAIRQISVQDAGLYDKGFQFDHLRALIGDGVGTTADAVKHRRQRRLLRPAFDHEHVERYVAGMARAAESAVRGWLGSRRIDAGAEMRALTMAVIARAVFDADTRSGTGTGTRPDTGTGSGPDSRAAREVLATLPTVLGGVGRRALLPIPALDRMPTRGNLAFERARARLREFADRMIAERRAAAAGATPAAHCLLDDVLAAVDDDGAGMSDAQAHDEVMTVLLAGTETTAGTLAWMLHVLAGDPALQLEIQREADAVLDGRAPTAADLAALKFTRCVVTEVLRLYPAGWIVGRRPFGDVRIAGVTVPAGSQVLLNFYGMHRDARVYSEPDRFDPGRWSDGKAGPPLPHFLPFGLGPHACLGEDFAMSQILVTAAVVASRCTVRPVPGTVVRPVARTTLHPGVVPLIVEER